MTVSLNADSPEVRCEFQLPNQHVHEVRLGEPWPPIADEIADLANRILEETGELPHQAEVAHMLCRAGIEAKLDWVSEAMGNESVVVLCEYTDSLDAAEKYLTDHGITFVRVDGGVTGKARVDCQDRFQKGEAQVFLGQMDAACTSMDLFRAYVSVALDHTWRGSNYNQALARTCRRGQDYECHHFDLIANRLQAVVVKRLRAAEDMNLQLTDWQDAVRASGKDLQ